MCEVMLTLFALVVVGFVAGKLGYLGGDFDRQLSRLVINITCPALILSSAMTGTLPDRRYILPLLLISTITYLLLTGAGFASLSHERQDRPRPNRLCTHFWKCWLHGLSCGGVHLRSRGRVLRCCAECGEHFRSLYHRHYAHHGRQQR